MAASPVPALPRPPATACAAETARVLAVVAERVEARLRRLNERETKRWSAVDRDVADVFATLATLLLAPAKRLRPAFCHWAFVGAGGHADDPLVADAGAAFELLHAFALFHDDVMDGSAARRGSRTCHLVYADRHETGRWTGEARRFG